MGTCMFVITAIAEYKCFEFLFLENSVVFFPLYNFFDHVQ